MFILWFKNNFLAERTAGAIKNIKSKRQAPLKTLKQKLLEFFVFWGIELLTSSVFVFVDVAPNSQLFSINFDPNKTIVLLFQFAMLYSLIFARRANITWSILTNGLARFYFEN